MKRYPNGALTGTCSVVRGPDEKPEVGCQGSECRSIVVSSSPVFGTNSSRRSTFVARRRDQFDLTNERENLAPPACQRTNVRAFIYTKTGPRINLQARDQKSLAACWWKNLHLFRCRSVSLAGFRIAKRKAEKTKGHWMILFVTISGGEANRMFYVFVLFFIFNISKIKGIF